MPSLPCSYCWQDCFIAEPQSVHEYAEWGLTGIVLVGGVTKVTRACGWSRPHYFFERSGQLMQAIALSLLTQPEALTGPEQRFLRRSCRLTQLQMADLLRLRRRETVSDREGIAAQQLAPADEFWFRSVVLAKFRAQLGSDGRNQLSQNHLTLLAEFESCLARFTGVLTERLGIRKTVLSFLAEGTWQLEPAAAENGS